MYYFNLYFIGAFIGFLFETMLKNFFFHSMNNGILYGPWIPVYGFGTVITSAIANKVFKLKLKKWKKVLLTFVTVVVLVTILEECGGLLIEYVFHKKFWNYKKMLFNFGPYICLEMSLLWGILSLLFACYLKPFLDLFIKKIPKVITYGMLILQGVDAVFTWLV